MSKVKQYAEDTAEKNVDLIISNLKDNQIDFDTAKIDILNTENITMLGINSENIDEVIMGNVNITENA